MKKILKGVIFVLLCIWQLPQLLVAAVMLPFCGKLRLVAKRHYNYCFEGSKMMGGISLGPICIVSKSLAKYPEAIAHETDGHTVDSKIMGPFYLLIIGLPSMLNATFNFTKCYYDFYPERWANKHAGLEVNHYCRLEFKEKEVQK